MNEKAKRSNLFGHGLLWFGAGVSIAEILTGTYLAPLGWEAGMTAIVLGHLIGGVLFFLTGLVSARSGKSAMEAVKMAYGRYGGAFFAMLNVLQLVGWTGIMIYDGALSATAIWPIGNWGWCVVIGALIVLWIMVGVRNFGRMNTITMTALFILTVIMCIVIMEETGTAPFSSEMISFGAALELSVSMPLSWLPVVGDYTKDTEEPVRAALVSTFVYGLVSSWMFLIGMGAAILAGTGDIAQIMLRAGLGTVGLLIIVFSTVTTAFLDAFSAGISAEAVRTAMGQDGEGKGKKMAVFAATIGTVAAILFPMDDITGLLYMIGSVFAPMVAVLLGAFFVLKTDAQNKACDWRNIFAWLVGFLIYRLLMDVDLPIGYTLPTVLITFALSVGLNKCVKA